MIALDTNVLVRLLTRDDAAQTESALRLVRRARDEGSRLFVADVVVCEVVWVLRACYAQSREQIAATLEAVASVAQAEFESHDRVVAALRAFRGGRGDIADYLIREHGRAAGCTSVATFDASLLGEPGFVHPEPSRWGPDVSLREDAPAHALRRRRRAARR